MTALAFADDGKTVAAAAENGTLYIYTSTSDGRSYKKLAKMGGGSELAHVDWNRKGDIVQTVSVDYKLEFWNVKGNKAEKNGGQLFRDEQTRFAKSS
jgi:WD40 repeat protein